MNEGMSMKVAAWLRRRQNYLVVCVPIALLMVIGLILLPQYQYQLNPDGTSYMSIAEKYANGDVRHAVNGYWGPILSWIMAPFIKLGADNLVVLAKVIALATSAATILILNAIFSFFKTPLKFRWFLFIPAVPIMLDWSLAQPVTGDLVFMAACCLVVLCGLRLLQTQSLPRAAMLGAAGAVLYSAKPIGFYYALASFIILAIILWRNADRKKAEAFTPKDAAKKIAPAFIVFFALASPWILALSMKYGQPTVATSSSLNHALVNPLFKGVEDANPLVNQVIPPANDTAISSWEDPSSYQLQDWKMFSSWGNMWWGIGLILSNLYAAIASFNKLSPFGGAILIGSIIYCVHHIIKRKGRFDSRDYVLMSALLLIGAYAPILILERYIYPSILLTTLLAVVLALPFTRKRMTTGVGVSVLIVLTLCTLHPTIADLHHLSNADKTTAKNADVLAHHIDKNDRLASNSLEGLYVSYYLDTKFYGVLQPATEDAVAEEVINANKIGYYLFMGDITQRPSYLKDARVVSSPSPDTHLLKL